ncbi:MAG TPA: hypothetical protein V6C65_01775 [Allocoleopsis sp.]
MCKICALAARASRVRQDALVFNLSQFATAVEAKSLSERSNNQPLTKTQKNTS